ncbi:unnamed protein product [Prunus armeniaca]
MVWPRFLSRPWGRMTFLLMRPWRNCNAIDEDGRTWCNDSNLATFVWPSTLVAPMIKVTVLASPSHSYAQNDGLGHGRSDGLDCNPVSPVSRVTFSPMVGVTILASPSHSCAQNDGPGDGRSDGLDCNPVSLMSRMTSSPMVGVTTVTLAGCTHVQSDGLGHGPSDGLGYGRGQRKRGRWRHRLGKNHLPALARGSRSNRS